MKSYRWNGQCLGHIDVHGVQVPVAMSDALAELVKSGEKVPVVSCSSDLVININRTNKLLPESPMRYFTLLRGRSRFSTKAEKGRVTSRTTNAEQAAQRIPELLNWLPKDEDSKLRNQVIGKLLSVTDFMQLGRFILSIQNELNALDAVPKYINRSTGSFSKVKSDSTVCVFDAIVELLDALSAACVFNGDRALPSAETPVPYAVGAQVEVVDDGTGVNPNAALKPNMVLECRISGLELSQDALHGIIEATEPTLKGTRISMEMCDDGGLRVTRPLHAEWPLSDTVKLEDSGRTFLEFLDILKDMLRAKCLESGAADRMKELFG